MQHCILTRRGNSAEAAGGQPQIHLDKMIVVALRQRTPAQIPATGEA
ncbi:MAG TPA: hypothetical protein VNP04_21420 [Alphaproteobacteria bacterium]|nr:hypothetical protein [Alphaproteobacteria bacterium]